MTKQVSALMRVLLLTVALPSWVQAQVLYGSLTGSVTIRKMPLFPAPKSKQSMPLPLINVPPPPMTARSLLLH